MQYPIKYQQNHLVFKKKSKLIKSSKLIKYEAFLFQEKDVLYILLTIYTLIIKFNCFENLNKN